jgi:arylformamidase
VAKTRIGGRIDVRDQRQILEVRSPVSITAAGIAMSGIFELGPIRDTYLNDKLKLTDDEIATLSPLRPPSVGKPLAITYGTAELPPFVEGSREYHAYRARSNYPGPLIPIPNANHYTSMEELRSPKGVLTRTAMRVLEDA